LDPSQSSRTDRVQARKKNDKGEKKRGREQVLGGYPGVLKRTSRKKGESSNSEAEKKGISREKRQGGDCGKGRDGGEDRSGGVRVFQKKRKRRTVGKEGADKERIGA